MVAQSQPVPVILTRPADQGARFAARLTAMAGDRVCLIQSPLLVPQFRSPSLPDVPFFALIFTSQAAVGAATRMARPVHALPRLAFCVGDQTALAARAAGFEAVSAQGDSAHLVGDIKRYGATGPLLHLRGQDTRGDVAGQLNSAGLETHEAIIYVQTARALTDEARAAFATPLPLVLPIFSPRTALVLRQELARVAVVAPIFTVCLSQAVSSEWKGMPRLGGFVASAPNMEAMVAAVQEALVAAQTA